MKGYSLHIGVDEVDQQHYCESMQLNSANVDAISFKEIVDNTKLFESSILLINTPQKKVTKELVFSEIDKMIRLSKDNPDELYYFFITVACHGISLSSDLGGEDGKLELLCFYNKMILEHEVRAKLVQFKANTKVFVVLGSCYGGGIFLEREKMRTIENIKPCSVVKDLQPYNILINDYHGKRYFYQADIAFLAAAEKDKVALESDAGEASNFIKWVIYFMAHFQFNHNYLELYRLLIDLYDTNFRPQFILRGINSGFFYESKPIFFNKNHRNTNFKTMNMNWELKLRYNSENRLFADIEYPETHKYRIYFKEKDREHNLLYGYQVADYEDEDYICILVCEAVTSGGGGSESIDLKLGKTSNVNLQRMAHVFLVDKDNRKVKKETKSSREVTDVIGNMIEK